MSEDDFDNYLEGVIFCTNIDGGINYDMNSFKMLLLSNMADSINVGIAIISNLLSYTPKESEFFAHYYMTLRFGGKESWPFELFEQHYKEELECNVESSIINAW